jgi:hypothetical protein
VAAAVAAAFGFLVSIAGLLLAVLTIREKLRASRPHPLAAILDARLAEIATALRGGVQP